MEIQRLRILKPNRFQRPKFSPHKRFLLTQQQHKLPGHLRKRFKRKSKTVVHKTHKNMDMRSR